MSVKLDSSHYGKKIGWQRRGCWEKY